ncbi:efflux RND transporter permease subunit [Haloferula chungangensis]|uniref:Efflux RND transporter permease subunit n=1 Tax=Haloferula chungangensis TaxID=1048331 RepID=A0ABW2L486_9BACT
MTHESKGLIPWFARNHIAANLLMITLLVLGGVTIFKIKQEVFPTFVLDTVVVDVQYRGASPVEVEQSVIVPIESELRGLEMVRRLEAVAQEGRGVVTAEIFPDFDRNRALQEITAAVQRIPVFPDEIEPPLVLLGEGRRRDVMRVAVSGDIPERDLVDFARQIETGLLSQPEISLVELSGVRQPEIEIEIPRETLRSLDLTLGDVADTIGEAALDVPGGTLRTRGGDLALRTKERRDQAIEFRDIPVVSTPDGSKVRLGDIATITDGFEESQREAYFYGKRSVTISVFSSENQAPLEVAAAVRRFIEKEQERLPDSVTVSLSRDRSSEFEERISLLLENGFAGLVLVVIALGLLLDLRVAFWTAIGIPVAILGSIALLPVGGSTINMISLFGFIVTLGIVVDDAVVVGEDIFHKMSEGMSRLDAAIHGAREMTTPVLFAVTTNVLAFLPLLFVPGETGQFFEVLPSVVIAVFTVSLIECLFILPAHLASAGKAKPSNSWFNRIDRAQTRVRHRIENAMDRMYRPMLIFAIKHRVITLASFCATLMIVAAWVWSGRIDFKFSPQIEADFIQAEIAMPAGTPVERTREVCWLVDAAAKRALEKAGEGEITTSIAVELGDKGANLGEVAITLVPQSQRKITGRGFADLWRDELPDIPDLESIFFDYLVGPGGEAEIDIELAHPDLATLRLAADEVAATVGSYPGVTDVRKGSGRETPELQFELTPEGRALGLTAEGLGERIRNSFYGAEALRQPRGREEVRVMVRTPESERRSERSLEELILLAPDGTEIPLGEAARIIRSKSPLRIERVDGGRVIGITANVTAGVTTGNKVLSSLEARELPEILERYPGLTYSFEGEQREQRDAMQRLGWGLLAAVFAVYAIMAAILRSYLQAFIILLTIPFSLAGAIVGHIVLDTDISIFSIFGMIALCGMVVNGGFVLAVTRERYIAEGMPIAKVTHESSARRCRPILLTAITTFLGLAPMIFETSIQALFLVPMAISLGVGTLASAIVILLVIPAAFTLTETLESFDADATVDEENR